jgi:FixJ family two-component response regulator
MADSSCVFVVDDDASARTGLTRLLRTAIDEVQSFSSADEFLEALDSSLSINGNTGCLVLDVRMPGLSGEALDRALKARGYHFPVIVVTADDDQATRRWALKMGAVGFFRKPIDGAALIDAVEWALQSTST